MIWDTFLFAGELDMLEVRLRALAPVVDRFVIAEATWTMRGKPKPLYWPLYEAGRFAQYANRVTYIPVTEDMDVSGLDTPTDEYWAREYYQRNALIGGLSEVQLGDVILHGDLDEIPRPSVVPGLAAITEPVVLEQTWHVYSTRWRRPDDLPGTLAVPARMLEGHSFIEFRATRLHMPRIPAAGWHFSWFGGPDAIRAKAPMMADDTDWAADGADLFPVTGWCPWDRVQMVAAEPDPGRPELPAAWLR